MVDDEEDLRAAAGVQKKKAKKPKEPANDDADELADEEPAPAPKKKSRKRKEPEPVQEPENDDEEEEAAEETEGLTPEQIAKKKKETLTSSREHKKCGGYRRLAKQAGYNRAGGTQAAQGTDMIRSCLTKDDAKRLARYFPEITKDGTFDKDEGFERAALSDQAMPPAVAREAQAFLEPVFRSCMNEALIRAVEDGINGKMKVAASHMYSAIRKYTPHMRYTGVLPPKGLIKHAVKEGEISQNDADQDSKAIAKEKEEVSAINKEIKRLATEAKKEKERKEEERRLAKERKDAEAAKAVAAQ